MHSTVALKNVRKEVWQQFKSESARHGLHMGAFFEKLVKEHTKVEKNSMQYWKRIIKSKPLLTNKEAKELESAMKEFRKGFTFRTQNL